MIWLWATFYNSVWGYLNLIFNKEHVTKKLEFLVLFGLKHYLFYKEIKSFWGNWNMLAEMQLEHSDGIILMVDVLSSFRMTLSTL